MSESANLNFCTAMAESKGFGGRGPAGTGKTETVKDLGKVLGRNVIVFNCGPHWTGEGMRKAVHGTVRGGFLIAFDGLSALTSEA
jgi:dynein heavy chain, axonemal